MSPPKDQQSELTPEQQFFLHNMAEPLVQAQRQSGAAKQTAIERRKRALAVFDMDGLFQQLNQRIVEDDSSQQQYLSLRLDLHQFDDEMFQTKSLSQWIKTTHPNEYLKCYYFSGEWAVGDIIGYNDQFVAVKNEDEQILRIPRLLCFIWGENPTLFAQKLENALISRNIHESISRFHSYIKNMPTSSLIGFNDVLKAEIIAKAIPIFHPRAVLGLKDDQLIIIKKKVMQIIEEQVEDIKKEFLRAQSQVLFEQFGQKSQALIAELSLDPALLELNEQRMLIFRNIDKSNYMYQYIVAAATLMKFVPTNCQFDDNGEPIVSMQELQLNVGIELLKGFKQSRSDLVESLLNYRSSQKIFRTVCKENDKLLSHQITEVAYSKKSLMSNYKDVTKLNFDEVQFNHCLYSLDIIQQEAINPLGSKTMTLQDFRESQISHQKGIKHYCEHDWIGQVKEAFIILFRNSMNKEFNLNVKNEQDFQRMKLWKVIKRCQLAMEDALVSLVLISTKQYLEMIKSHSLWNVKAKSTWEIENIHPDNISSDQSMSFSTCFRLPLFKVFVIKQETVASMEDKNLYERLEKDYIYGVQCLGNDRLKLDDDDPEENEVQSTDRTEIELDGSTIYSQFNIEMDKDKAEIFTYLTDVQDYVSAILYVYDQGLQTVAQFPLLQQYVINTLAFPDQICMKSPLTDIPEYEIYKQQFASDRQHLEQYAMMMISPLNDYIKEFNKYKEILFLDSAKWTSTIKYKAELYIRIQTEQQSGKSMEVELPSNISPDMKNSVDTAEALSPADLRSIVYAKLKQSQQVLQEIPEVVHVGCFIVDNKSIREYLSKKCADLAQGVQMLISDIGRKKVSFINQIYVALVKKLNKQSQNIEECVKIEEFIHTKLDNFKNIIKQNLVTMNEYYGILDELFCSQNNQSVNDRWKAMGYLKDLQLVENKKLQVIEIEKVNFKDKQNVEQNDLQKTLDSLGKRVTTFASKYITLDKEKSEAAFAESEALNQQLQDQKLKAALYNKREQLMGLPLTDYSSLEQLIKDFEPQSTLWKCWHEFKETESMLDTIDFKFIMGQKTKDTIDGLFKSISTCTRNIKEQQVYVKDLAEQVKKEISLFKNKMPLLLALRNPGLRRRHWMRIKKETGVNLDHLKYINGLEIKNYQVEEPNPENPEQIVETTVNTDEYSETDYCNLSQAEIDAKNQEPVGFTFLKHAFDYYHLNEPHNFETIQKISDAATKEYGIEQIINQLEDTWNKITFNLTDYQNSGSYILRALDDIIQTLDDNIVLVQSMSFSPFKKFFEGIIAKWEKNLADTSEIIEVWILLQQNWLYLEPIFTSADIVRQLPTESKLFREVDGFFKAHMAKTHKNPNVIKICTETKDLLINLQKNNKSLEIVQKALSDYLETKRIAFPRFFFLSDEELLSILSNTKNPTAVQPFLRSCFENVSRLKFLEDNYEMISMTSHEGEVVQFVDPLIPSGNVEVWMGQLEKQIIKTVKVRCLETLEKYISMVLKDGLLGRADWVKSGFAQGVILVNQIMFANDTEYAISGKYLMKYIDHLNEQLNAMTELVRKGLNKLESKVFSALLTYDVFQRDQVEALVEAKVVLPTDFEWLKHPKHYCNVDPLYQQPIHGASDNYYMGNYTNEEYSSRIDHILNFANDLLDSFQVSFNSILSTLPYAFEYLGNTGRLVITPLTLKIYSTISQSQAMYKFTSASGPAGSGKTETSKQMANKEFGLVCVVFNCSEGLDLIGIKRMLSGVISSGGCLVMDEINRLSLDVLSVFAQMVLGVQRGLQSGGGCIVTTAKNIFGKSQANIQVNGYIFEGAALNLQSTATVIITQNPNYSGRQKLPANLVALFRAVSVMVPNYMKIAQIRLYSFGFKQATQLAQKAVSVFKLCSEQLSQQSWYDYGMRAINTTVQSVGNLRQQLGNLCVQKVEEIPRIKKNDGSEVSDPSYYTEQQIVLRAINETNLPKFLENDALLFRNIMSDLFPNVQQPFIDYNVLQTETRKVLHSNIMKYLQPEDPYIDKIIDLYMTIQLRHGLMTLGAAHSGKTNSIYGLMHTLNRLNEAETAERLDKFISLVKSNPTMPLSQAVSIIPEDYTWEPMSISRLNPKSITMDQLFGQFDAVSKEWQDGILSTQVRNAVQDYNKHKEWVEQNLYIDGYKYGQEPTVSDVNPKVYVARNNYTRIVVNHDGYVDSLWIESLNTVLDDSKRLCLTSGEIIALSPVMNMLFNMDSVAEASPATISRCGMLYYTGLNITSVGTDVNAVGNIVVTGTLSPQAYINSWIDNIPDQIRLERYDVSQENVKGKVFESRFGKSEQLSVIATTFKELMQSFLVESIAYIHHNCDQLQETMDANLLQSVFRILNTFIQEIKPNDYGVIEDWQMDSFSNYFLEPVFFFSLVWGIGGTLANESSRQNFSTWLRKKIDDMTYLSDLPIPDNIDGKSASVFDFCLEYDSYDIIREKQNSETIEGSKIRINWVPWGSNVLNNINMEQQLNVSRSKNAMMNINLADCIIPTASNIQQSYLIRRLLLNGYSALVVGQTGSGKTAIIKNYLLKHETDTKFNIPLMYTFSANTQAGHIQQYLDNKLEKRRRGIFGPPAGKKYILYIDDLNLPMKERYGCINSHELLRQLLSHGGWFDLKELNFKTVIDTFTVSSMVQTGGSRAPVTQRVLRHFNCINFLEMNDAQLFNIFYQIINWWDNKQFSPLGQLTEKITQPIIIICKKFVEAGIQIYNEVRTGLLPTPAKMHYTYNLRDLSKLFQGFMMIDPASILVEKYENGNKATPIYYEPQTCVNNITRLFVHENLRVFSDRLVNHDDQKWFLEKLDGVLKDKTGMSVYDIVDQQKSMDSLIFGDFLSDKDPKTYNLVSDSDKLKEKLAQALTNCNEISSSPMNLVLFEMAIQHLARIIRILRQSSSNMLLIGVGGVGRQSLTKLAASWLGFDLKQIELKKGYGISEWREEIKLLLLDCGLKGKDCVFMLADQHIFDDKQLEDISILLNTCDMQTIYEVTDLNDIYQNTELRRYCVEAGIQESKPNIYDMYLQQIKKHIHLVLCFSPSGTSLRTRLRKFPSLINCCSIDYMFNWPNEALTNVARQILGFEGSIAQDDNTEFFNNVFLKEQVQRSSTPLQQIQNNVVQYCVSFHESIEKFSDDYKNELKRHNHVTPTLFLNLLQYLQVILQENYKKSNTYKMQLSSGLSTLKKAQEDVTKLEEELTREQPKLIQISKEVDEMMISLERDQQEVEQTRQVVQKEKQEASASFEESQTIKQKADSELAEAEPELERAIEVLSQLERSDFAEIAGYANPKDAIKYAMESVCVLLGQKPKKVVSNGQNVDDYLEDARKMMTNSGIFIERLKNFRYKIDEVTPDTIKKLKKYIDWEGFTPPAMMKVSKACGGLCAYVIGMYKYYHVYQNVKPLRQKQAEAEEKLRIVEEQLKITTDKYNEAEAKLADLKRQFNDAVQQKEDLTLKIEDTVKCKERAQSLIISLGGEQTRWTQQLAQIELDMQNILGDSLFAASCVIYTGAFNSVFRHRISQFVIELLQQNNIKVSDSPKITNILSDQVTLMNYINSYGLPSDQHSMENATIMFSSQKFCLMIDPEQQAQQFIKNYYKDQGLEIAKATDKDLLRNLENCIRFGKILLVVGITNEIDPGLGTVLEQQFVYENNSPCIKVGDKRIPYNSSFKIYLCTQLPNPNYSPEQFVKLTVVNFAITQQGLQDQLLGLLVGQECPEQEKIKAQLVVSNSKRRVELKNLEQKVLFLLGNNDSDILRNEQLIDTLSLSQKTSKEITEEMKISEQTEAEIDEIRKQYIPMADRAAILYFCVQDLQRIEFMYQYSLNWYIQLYIQSIQDTESSDDIAVRLKSLIDHFTYFLFECICRSLFDSHKLLFAFLMTVRISLSQERIKIQDLKYLLVGCQSITHVTNVCSEWINDKSWNFLNELEQTNPQFKGIVSSFSDPQNCALWKALFESEKPEEAAIPQFLENELSLFQKVLVIQAIRPDRIMAFVRLFIEAELGNKFVQPQVFNLERSFKDSNNLQPILFLLNDMADPISDLVNFAEQQHMGNRIQVLSLGRGIEKTALNLISQFAERGSWCVLQNCHLSVNFLKQLDQSVEQLNSDPQAVNRDFRLWLSSQPTTEFPVGILQNSVKISVENPNNLKSNLLRVWQNQISDKMLNDSCKNEQNIEKYKKLTYSLSLFYSVLLQRKKYGSIGFNTPYPWSASDVQICIQQLPMFLDRYMTEYPKNALFYLFASINIGGCVTDAIDQRTVDALIQDFIDERVINENWCFQEQKQADSQTPNTLIVQCVNELSYRDYLDHIQNTIPIECHPHNIGLNSNSNITADRNESHSMLTDFLVLQTGKLEDSTVKDDKKEADKVVKVKSDVDLVKQFLSQVPKAFNIEEIMLKYPIRFDESLNSLLVQECTRFNTLIETMSVNLAELIEALQGKTIMSTELEDVLKAVVLNRQPELFQRYSYPSLKPLSSYMQDMDKRVLFFRNWVEFGKPHIYNISSFFFAQGFLTSVMQNFARKYTIAIDQITFNFQVMEEILDDEKYVMNNNKISDEIIVNKKEVKKSSPFEDFSDATYITGLYLEAARFDHHSKKITESYPRELYSKIQIIQFNPANISTDQIQDASDPCLYQCPCYRTFARFGLLSTTGHSTNFMLMIYLPCEEGTARHWIKRSVALFTSLSD